MLHANSMGTNFGIWQRFQEYPSSEEQTWEVKLEPGAGNNKNGSNNL